MEKTVLILGAGASADFGFPIGSELLDLILLHLFCDKKPDNSGYQSDMVNQLLKNFTGKIKVDEMIDFKYFLWKEYQDNFIYEIRNVKDKIKILSIDRLVNEYGNQNSTNIGKLAIAYFLYGFEYASLENDKGYFNDCKDVWMYHLVKLLKTYAINEIKENLQIITFNYDRVLEHYLFSQDKDLYNALKDNITHFYGSLGNYESPDTKYGLKNDDLNVEVLNKFQLIYDERTDSKETQEKLENAKNIYFLGFGYDNTNLKKLGFFDISLENKTISGTGKEPASTREEVNKIHFTGSYCKEFIEKGYLNFN